MCIRRGQSRDRCRLENNIKIIGYSLAVWAEFNRLGVETRGILSWIFLFRKDGKRIDRKSEYQLLYNYSSIQNVWTLCLDGCRKFYKIVVGKGLKMPLKMYNFKFRESYYISINGKGFHLGKKLSVYNNLWVNSWLGFAGVHRSSQFSHFNQMSVFHNCSSLN